MSIRVVQISCTPSGAGWSLDERLRRWPTTADIASAVADAGAEVTVLLAGAGREELRRDNILYRQLPQLRWPTLADPLWSRAAGLALAHRPDVIHVAGLEAPVPTRALCASGVPVLVQDHASRPRRRAAALWRWGHGRIAGAAFTARAQADPFLKCAQLPAHAQIFVIPESSSRFSMGRRDEARARTDVFGAPALLWVGHLNANKDPLTVLRAIRRARPCLPDLQLWCAFGDAPLLPEIDAMLADDPDLGSRVHLMGRLPHGEMETLYRACDGFVSASRREGSGYALIEALACGLRAIVTDIPSFRELTGNGAVGSLVPIGNADAMAEALVSEFGGIACRSEASSRAVRRHFDAHLSFAAVGAKLMDAYAVLAAGTRRACE